MGRARGLYLGNSGPFTEIRLGAGACPASSTTSGTSLGVTVGDLFYVGLTIIVFAALLLILKGLETFERCQPNQPDRWPPAASLPVLGPPPPSQLLLTH